MQIPILTCFSPSKKGLSMTKERDVSDGFSLLALDKPVMLTKSPQFLSVRKDQDGTCHRGSRDYRSGESALAGPLSSCVGAALVHPGRVESVRY